MSSIQRTTDLLLALLDRDGVFDAEVLSSELGSPPSTLFRHLDALVRSGLLVKVRRGLYRPGPALLRRTERFERNRILADVARPELDRLARERKTIAHLGVFENDMVTYVVKAALREEDVFTREGQQLEAYCSGIGKVLLASLPVSDREAYLAGGPFPRLTENTITERDQLSAELEITRKRDFGIDDAEVHENLFCLAVPVRDARSEIVAAISMSSPERTMIQDGREDALAPLRLAGARISARLGATTT